MEIKTHYRFTNDLFAMRPKRSLCMKIFLIGLIPLVIGTALLISLILSPTIPNKYSWWVTCTILFFGFGAVCTVSLGVLLLIFSLHFRKLRKQLNTFGEDDVLDQINHHTIHVFMKKKWPQTFFTEKYVFDLENAVLEVSSIDMAYGADYYGKTCIALFPIDGHQYNVCPGIDVQGRNAPSDEKILCLNALAQANETIMIGYTATNTKMHSAHCKEYKKDRANTRQS